MDPSINISDAEGVAIVELHGEHDLATASQVDDALGKAIEERRPVVVELTLTDFIDSSILGVMLGGLRRAREVDVGFVFVVQSDDARAVNRTLAGSGLLAFFPVRGSLDEAIAAARSGTNRPT